MRSIGRNPLQGPSAERGFSILESMMASVILSTGLLALAAMQGVAMMKNVDANELTRMTAVTSDILERIQFNRKNAALYEGIDTTNPAHCNTIVHAQVRGDCLLWGTMVTDTRLQDVRGMVKVSNELPPTILGQRSITVTLTWTGSQNGNTSVKRPRSLTVDRILAME